MPYNWESISFLGIIQAIEDKASLFECHFGHGLGFPIEQVIVSTEAKMEEELKEDNNCRVG